MDVRTKKILTDIRDENNRLMPCGDVRAATLLKNGGFVKLVHPKSRQFISGYIITQKGADALV